MATFGNIGLGFHQIETLNDGSLGLTPAVVGQQKRKFTYTFQNHFHPFVGELLERLNRQSIDGLLDAGFHESLEQHFFNDLYDPNTSDRTVDVETFPKRIDVSERGAYSVYNWELLFHIPLIIAVHLSKNQRFAEAQRWFHYIFDPTAGDGRFWRFLAFRRKDDPKQIDRLLRLLSKPDDECTEEELAQKELVLSGYETIRHEPFQPHAVARTRFLAYQYCVVMKYLDNLIAWGDSLFRQDTIETLNEATQLYVLAANLLGRRPERIPRRGRVQPKTFAQLRASGLDQLGNALVELEGRFPFNLYSPTTEGLDSDESASLFGIGRTLYFCIPQNEGILDYWDTVADRLFKIRHCMNIEGVVRQLPLFQPPLDPGMLVKAAAAGIDVSSLVSGLNQPLAPVRSQPLIRNALEICNEVRRLGDALLSALEKGDAESLGAMRQRHELNLRQMSQDVRYLRWKEAEATTEALLKSRAGALERYRFYEKLLGRSEDDLEEGTDFTLERRELTEENFDEVYSQLVEEYGGDAEPRTYAEREVLEEGSLFLNRKENEELNEQMPRSAGFQTAAHVNDAITAGLYYIPNFKIKMSYWGIGGDTEIAGGTFLGNAGEAVSSGLRGLASFHSHNAAVAAKTASYERRADDWMLQSNLAARELSQIGREIISSLIREQITRHEYENQKKEIEQAREIDSFLNDKFTNQELYGWMQGELSKVYYEYYQFAFDIARKAERTMKHELMRPELDAQSFVQFNYWDGGRKGLLAGEALHFDLKRMEMAYHDHNKREYELTRSISLRQLDPVALLTLKATAACEVSLPEWLFDMDCPGHYIRRIKHVGVSIPAVTGPFTSVNCTLSLLSSTVRRLPDLKDGAYSRAEDEEDDRFIDYHGTIQSIVTSRAQDDSGMFDGLPQDDRFLPFEGAGAISRWRLELPASFRQFDYDTITDVVLHVRYTARQGGARLAEKATEHLNVLVSQANTSGLARIVSLRHEFPNEWHRFLSGEGPFSARVEKQHFPYLVQGRAISISGVELYAVEADEIRSTVPEGVSADDLTTALQDTGALELSLEPDGNVLRRERDAEVFLLLRYFLE